VGRTAHVHKKLCTYHKCPLLRSTAGACTTLTYYVNSAQPQWTRANTDLYWYCVRICKLKEEELPYIGVCPSYMFIHLCISSWNQNKLHRKLYFAETLTVMLGVYRVLWDSPKQHARTAQRTTSVRYFNYLNITNVDLYRLEYKWSVLTHSSFQQDISV
jgi:hypothetical protein